jgi:hypothetical protein
MNKKALSAAIAAAAIALIAAGCGIGEPTAKGEIAAAADDYLRALAEDDTAKACAQLAATAKSELDRPCEDELHEVAGRIGSDALSAAADGGVDVRVDGARGFAEIRDLDGARLTFAKAGTEWRITSGHALDERGGETGTSASVIFRAPFVRQAD